MTGDKFGKRINQGTTSNFHLALARISINIKDIETRKASRAVGKLDYGDKLLVVLRILGIDLLLSLSFY